MECPCFEALMRSKTVFGWPYLPRRRRSAPAAASDFSLALLICRCLYRVHLNLQSWIEESETTTQGISGTTGCKIFKSAASDACEGRTEQSMAGCLCLLSGPFCKPFEEEVACLGGYSDVHPRLHRPSDRPCRGRLMSGRTWMIIITESPNRFQCFGNFSRFSQQQKASTKNSRSRSLDGIGAYLCLRWYQAPAASGQLCDAVTAEWTNGMGIRALSLKKPWNDRNRLSAMREAEVILRSLSHLLALIATSVCAWPKLTPTRILDAPVSTDSKGNLGIALRINHMHMVPSSK